MHSSTTEDLLQYMYKETSPEKTAEISAAIESDWNLKEKFEALSASSKSLEPIEMSPRQQTIDAIMSYAEKRVEELTPQA